jgi:mono/diheme cytochrome c family protein
MKPVQGTNEEIAALVEYVYWLGGEGPVDAALRERGAALFKERDCDECHEVDGKTAGGGPNFGGWGTEAWLVEFLRDPAGERYYPRKNKMPRFGDRLSQAEIESLARLIHGERGAR